MELPESVLLCLFPNGVVLSPQRAARQMGEDGEDEGDVYYVEVSWRVPLVLTRSAIGVSRPRGGRLAGGMRRGV